MSETPCNYRYPRSGGGSTYPCLSYADAEDGRCAAHRDWQARAARLEVDLRAAREEAAGLRATAFELRKIIVDSANVCTLKGCEHCKWLGFNLGRYESLAALASAEPAPSGGGDA